MNTKDGKCLLLLEYLVVLLVKDGDDLLLQDMIGEMINDGLKSKMMHAQSWTEK